MLITTCTHCLARFRVTPQQLNLKQGRVRCGRCGTVFSGFEALERFPDDDTGARLLAAHEAELSQSSPPRAEPPAPVEELPEFEALDVVPAPAPAPEPKAGTPPPSAKPAANAPPANAPPASAPPRKAASAAHIATALAVPARTTVSRAWAAGVFLLVLLLAGELLFAFRGFVAQGYPPLRPWLEAACARAGCRIPWSREERLLKLEDSELLEVPGHPNEIALAARIRNLAPVPQEYPHLELTLTDIAGQAAVRRVLRPADYLGRAPASNEALAAGSEIAIQMRLATARVKATGYELLLFYP